MAGIGIRLNRIFNKNTMTANLFGFGYGISITIAPMLLVILTIFLMMRLLGFSDVVYAKRELFSSSMLYIFIFSLMMVAPFNAVISKYMSDTIYEERYEDIMPCFQLGLLMNLALGCLVGIPFCVWEYFVGHVDIVYVFTGFCGYIALILVFYTSIYVSICKEYGKISVFYFAGMITAVVTALVFVYLLHWEVTYSMLLSLVIGFLVTASLEMALICVYFRENSNQYKKLLLYFKKYRLLVVTNFLYTLGLFVHNFVFWNTDLRMVVVNTFVSAEAYDMATCLAMFTNISASVIFLSRVEMYFHKTYKAYSEEVIGGRWVDIEKAKNRMFQQLSGEIMNLARIQFIISVIIFIVLMVCLPYLGFSGLIFRIYPSLAAAYFVVFLMYGVLIFLYYFDDLPGAFYTTAVFCLISFLGSLLTKNLQDIWYGIGFFAGAFAGWCVAYYRLRRMEKNFDTHIFCRGTLIEKGSGKRPDHKVFDVKEK